ncbi:unnamed protein product [Pedinophyceae sp. YPF-701]|nr:unnamed protein product [Pedinophyceae sp. YPF-701]
MTRPPSLRASLLTFPVLYIVLALGTLVNGAASEPTRPAPGGQAFHSILSGLRSLLVENVCPDVDTRAPLRIGFHCFWDGFVDDQGRGRNQSGDLSRDANFLEDMWATFCPSCRPEFPGRPAGAPDGPRPDEDVSVFSVFCPPEEFAAKVQRARGVRILFSGEDVWARPHYRWYGQESTLRHIDAAMTFYGASSDGLGSRPLHQKRRECTDQACHAPEKVRFPLWLWEGLYWPFNGSDDALRPQSSHPALRHLQRWAWYARAMRFVDAFSTRGPGSFDCRARRAAFVSSSAYSVERWSLKNHLDRVVPVDCASVLARNHPSPEHTLAAQPPPTARDPQCAAFDAMRMGGGSDGLGGEFSPTAIGGCAEEVRGLSVTATRAGRSPACKLPYLQGYLFAVAPETWERAGYVTEKAFHAVLSGAVPIYGGARGAPEPGVLNADRMILMEDFSRQSLEAVQRRVRELLATEGAREVFERPLFARGAAREVTERYREVTHVICGALRAKADAS